MRKIVFNVLLPMFNMVLAIMLIWKSVSAEKVNITEMMHKYKNYVVTQKYETEDNYYMKVKNPYKTNLIHKSLIVPSGIYYNYFVGDTIGKHKQIYWK